MAAGGHFEKKLTKNVIITIMWYVISDQYWGIEPTSDIKMIILGFNASKFDKKRNSLLSAYIIHIAHFLNLYGADMWLILFRWVTYIDMINILKASQLDIIRSVHKKISRFLPKVNRLQRQKNEHYEHWGCFII